MRQWKKLLAWCIQAASIHCLQEGTSGHMADVSYTFNLQAENNSSIGFREGEYAGRNGDMLRRCAANHSCTRRERWKATPSHAVARRQSIFGLNLSFSRCIKEMRNEEFCIVWANSRYVANHYYLSVSVCLFVNRITEKVMHRFVWTILSKICLAHGNR